MIAASLEEVGPFRSIAVDGDDIVRAGNGVFAVAERLGLKIKLVDAAPDTLIAVRRKDLKGRKAVRAALYDNRAQELSVWDSGRLSTVMRNDAELLNGIFRDEATAIEAMAEGSNRTPAVESETPEQTLVRLQKKWDVKTGDRWVIESVTNPGLCHYLYCGDFRTVEFDRRFNGIFTSPPYAEQRKKRYGGIAEKDYVAWWQTVQAHLKKYLAEGGSFFVNIKPHAEDGQRSLYVMDLVCAMRRDMGWRYIEEYCWLKPKMPGKDRFRFRNGFEPVYQFTLSERPAIYHKQVARIGQGEIYRDKSEAEKFDGSNIFSESIDDIAVEILPSNVIQTGSGDGIHPATFPPKLPEFFIQAFSRLKDFWLDPFVGSGSTLRAAERCGRLGVGVDLMPAYIALSLENLELEGLNNFSVERGAKKPRRRGRG